MAHGRIKSSALERNWERNTPPEAWNTGVRYLDLMESGHHDLEFIYGDKVLTDRDELQLFLG